MWDLTAQRPPATAWRWAWIGAAVLLGLATLAGATLLQRHVVVSGQVLADPTFATLGDAHSPWERHGTGGRLEPVPGGLSVSNDVPAHTVILQQDVALPPGADGLRLAATVRLDDVVRGPERWQRARIFLLGLKADGRPDFSRPHRFLHTAGTLAARPRSQVFTLDPTVDRARVLIALPRATGGLVVTDLELRAVATTAPYRAWRTVVTLGWTAFALVALLAFWRRSRNRRVASVAIGGVVVVAGLALLPYDLRAPVQAVLGDWGGDGGVGELKLVAHVVLFALLAIACRRLLARLPPTRLWCGLAAAGLLLEGGEWLQGTLDRGDAVDFGANLAGATLGLGVALMAERWSAYRGRRRALRHIDELHAAAPR